MFHGVRIINECAKGSVFRVNVYVVNLFFSISLEKDVPERPETAFPASPRPSASQKPCFLDRRDCRHVRNGVSGFSAFVGKQETAFLAPSGSSAERKRCFLNRRDIGIKRNPYLCLPHKNQERYEYEHEPKAEQGRRDFECHEGHLQL